jgi:hypothetical protein
MNDAVSPTSVENKDFQPDSASRSRLSEVKTLRHLQPFFRATQVNDVSLYWLPVTQYPIPFRQREWILELLERLSARLKQDKQIAENFLQLKYSRTELNDEFVNTMLQYRPMTGLVLAPGQLLPAVPTSLEIKKLTESHGSSGELNLDHLAPDYCAWFAGTQQAEQRRSFFGIGGTITIWLDEGQEPSAPKFEIPRVLATHPAMKGVNFEEQMSRGMRLQHPFLKQSREAFAEHLPDSPAKRHSMFVLPRFASGHLVTATEQQRKKWFELFSGYCIESEAERGVLLVLRHPDFDDELIKILEAMREEKKEYPL